MSDKKPFFRAVIRDDGKGAFHVIMAIPASVRPDGTTQFACLTMKAGTTKDEAMTLAQAINDKLADVSIFQM